MNGEEAIKTLHELRRETNDSWYKKAYNMAIEALSADKVEVVRCKDCKNRAKHVVCHFLGEDGFCPYGERREGDEVE